MIFSSFTFLFYFLPIVLLLYYVVPNKLKNIILLISSLFFYFFSEPKFFLMLIVSITITFFTGKLLNNVKDKKQKKIILIIFLITIVGIFIYFKYMNFFIKNLNILLTKKISFINIILPIGISFYTFQIISYIVDVYNQKVRPQESWIKLALYISMFPQLIAGPIVRYSTVNEQINNRNHNIEKFAKGVRRFIIGLGKKVLIANVLGELVNICNNTVEPNVLMYWMYAISNMLQIYFDFSGYSDMAIGLGKMFGFEFEENFNYPYISTTITEFWRRWHISLGTWFRDYIYIPLGGNRVKKWKWLRNLLVVWALTGLWHGAEWNFIIWGIYFGFLLIFEKIFLEKILLKLPKIFRRFYVLLLIMISFIIFSNTNIKNIITIIKGLIGIGTIKLYTKESIYYFTSYFIVFIIGILSSTKIFKEITQLKTINKIINILEPLYLLIILILSTSYIIDGSFNPFLYFRF